MPADMRLKPELCNCLALRQAARHVTQFYDQFLAAAGLGRTQFSILTRLRRLGPMTISALAADLVMDRTTLGRNLQPLEREGLVAVVTGRTDRRSREIRLTDTGAERLRTAIEGWVKAQAGFEAVFGELRSSELRPLLHAVSGSQLEGAERIAARTAGLGVTGPPAIGF
jgi:DNA-binding MarR family transcriptional regulator